MADQSSNHSEISCSRSVDTVPNGGGLNEEFTIRVLTLNCWGLWLGAKKRLQRMQGIVRYLRENNCDIVFLQEVWVSSDFEIIRQGTQDIYRFAHLYRSGSVLKSSGIVILCKWLPKVIHFEPYSVNGSPFYPWHGDWFAGKGIAYSRVDFDGLSLHLFSTHTHAYYNENESVHDQYSVHRVCQSYELARFINIISDTASNGKTNGKDLLIVAGDMNSTSSQLPYKILTNIAHLTDCFKTSRNSNFKSNIVHKHKIMANRQKLSNLDNLSSSSSNNSQSEGVRFCPTNLRDNFLLDTLDECRQKIAQVLFDSDTDDEDITYCHPRNSFTPTGVEYKPFKFTQASSIPLEITAEQKDNSASLKEGKQQPNERQETYRFSDKNGSYTKQRLRSKKSPMKRIDFILCRLLTHGHCVVDRIATESKDPTLNCSLSDHEPVMVELKISDVSHDLVEKNRIAVENTNSQNNRKQINGEHVRPLASVVESKVSPIEASQIEETTNQWANSPVDLSYQECNIQVMEETRDVLVKYYQYNRTSKTQLFYIVLFMYIITLPSSTYYTLANDLLPISTVISMWFAATLILAGGLFGGFLSYRFEQGAIEALLNDISRKIFVAKDHQQPGKSHQYEYR